MIERPAQFEAILNRNEVSDQWVDVGGNNVVFRVGETALKVCLSLPNKYLEDPHSMPRLEEVTRQEVEKINQEAAIFGRYFGDSFLDTESYQVRSDIHGKTVQKMYDEHDWRDGCRLSPDTLYKDVPLVITEQQFFNPYQAPNSDVTSFVIGKGDFFHYDYPPSRDTYERMNNILLRGDIPQKPLDPDEVYEVQKSQSLVYYMTMLRQDTGFKEMMRDLLPKIARYTHETGGIVDLFAVRPNGHFIQNGRTGEWTSKFFDMSTSDWLVDINEIRRQVLSEPFGSSTSDDAVKHTNMIMSHMRSINVLAIESGLGPLFNILCENGNPHLPPDCQLSPGGWWAVYEKIQSLIPSMHEGALPSYLSICASVWRGA